MRQETSAGRGRRWRWVYPVYLLLTVAIGLEAGARWLFPEHADTQRLLQRAYERLLNSAVARSGAADLPLGYRLTPDERRTLRRGSLTYTVATNSLGFRGREPAPRQPGEYRVLFLGDSMVFGDGLEEDETIPARFEAAAGDLRARVVAYNGALSGMNTVDELLVARQLVPALAPDHVILGFFVGNDPLTNTIAFVDSAGRYAADDAAAQRLRTALDEHLRAPLNSYAFRAIALPVYVPHLRYRWASRADVVERSCSLIERVRHECADGGARFSVTVIYSRDGVAGGLSDLWSGSRRVGRRIDDCLGARGIEVLDTTEFMSGRRARNDFYFEYDGHFNARGATRVARELVQRLIDPRDID